MAYTRTTWVNGSGGGTPISAANLNNIEVQLVAWDIEPATTLPGSPANRQRAILVDSLTAPTYAWQFQYVSGISDANEWLFVGGSPLYAEVVTSESTASTSYAALSTAGPSVALPRAGVYVVEHGFEGVAAGAASSGPIMSYDIGGTGAVDADSVQIIQNDAATPRTTTQVMRRRVKSGLTAVTLTSKYKAANSNSVTFKNRWISVTPVRVA